MTRYVQRPSLPAYTSTQARALTPLRQYLYHVLKRQSSLPAEALYMIRYHSFYPWHREGAYAHLTNVADQRALEAVRAFNPYDLYSKSDEPVVAERVKPYYQRLIAKYFPEVIEW